MRKDFRFQEHLYKNYNLESLLEYQKRPLIEISKKDILDKYEEGSEFYFPFEKANILLNYFELDSWALFSYESFDISSTEHAEYFKYFKERCARGLPYKKALIEQEEELISYIIACSKKGDQYTFNGDNVFCLLGKKSNVMCAGEYAEELDGSASLSDINFSDSNKIQYEILMRTFSLIGKYLYQTNMRMVEKRAALNTQGTVRKICKNVSKKPWLREDLPSIILIDPNDTKSYGRKDSQGGTHASPRPHQRRGHFRKLISEKFKFKKDQIIKVKSCWVGDSEWVYNGSTYKVLEDKEGVLNA